MAEAVRYLHTELYMVHRDLHWKNWMVQEDGKKVTLIDFGIATTLGPNGKSAHYWNDEMFGAPEIIKCEETDFGGDVFYLGNTFYTMLHPKRYTPWSNG
jgi:serine/threonine protein kinase